MQNLLGCVKQSIAVKNKLKRKSGSFFKISAAVRAVYGNCPAVAGLCYPDNSLAVRTFEVPVRLSAAPHCFDQIQLLSYRVFICIYLYSSFCRAYLFLDKVRYSAHPQAPGAGTSRNER